MSRRRSARRVEVMRKPVAESVHRVGPAREACAKQLELLALSGLVSGRILHATSPSGCYPRPPPSTTGVGYSTRPASAGLVSFCPGHNPLGAIGSGAARILALSSPPTP